MLFCWDSPPEELISTGARTWRHSCTVDLCDSWKQDSRLDGIKPDPSGLCPNALDLRRLRLAIGGGSEWWSGRRVIRKVHISLKEMVFCAVDLELANPATLAPHPGSAIDRETALHAYSLFLRSINRESNSSQCTHYCTCTSFLCTRRHAHIHTYNTLHYLRRNVSLNIVQFQLFNRCHDNTCYTIQFPKL